ncbi:uncharacterized protein LOC118266434 [Spodoptera frugiperda]|uniref:Uncharacterized protein LOC118266434 n=1 Tax=Spodoptera frugiperda TaxID=7108 RepID=A0A9R0D058_SPOFR|nr:uncharacterized protein LOC118266434 [Spodoptera frugiperda]
MDNIKRVLIKIIIFTVIIAILSASVTEAKKSKRHSSKLSKRHFEHIEKYHKAKRSTYGRSWGKESYSGYGMPPYLIYNRKLGAYYPYYNNKPENNNRRSMNVRKSYYDSRRYS